MNLLNALLKSRIHNLMNSIRKNLLRIRANNLNLLNLNVHFYYVTKVDTTDILVKIAKCVIFLSSFWNHYHDLGVIAL